MPVRRMLQWVDAAFVFALMYGFLTGVTPATLDFYQ